MPGIFEWDPLGFGGEVLMIIVLKPKIEQQALTVVTEELSRREAQFESTKMGDRNVLIIQKILDRGPKVDWLGFEAVERLIQFKSEYPKVSEGVSSVKVGDLEIGPGRLVVIAGPCAVENEEQLGRIAQKVRAAGARILRGGAYKPRTSPYSFQGVGIDGLKALDRVAKQHGLKVVTEALDLRDLQTVAEHSDIIQIGSRNMQNFPLLKEAGRLNRPIFLKRGMSATLQEWLLAAEYIAQAGNPNIILCERGIRSFDPMTRNLLDLSCLPLLRQETSLPLAVDPSHGTGRREAVESMSLAAAAAGANALMIEVHDQPEHALSDGFQAIRPEALERIVFKLRQISEPLGFVVS